MKQEKDVSLTLTTDGFQFTPTGLIVEGQPTYETWAIVGCKLQYVEGAVHWWIGDWLNYGERAYGETYAQAIEETGHKYQTVANDKYVAGKIEVSHRRENVDWSTHAEVAALPPEQQDYWLDKAEAEGFTRQDLRQHIRSARLANVNRLDGEYRTRLIHGDMLSVVPTLGRFDLIVTDPPYGVVPKYDSVDPLEWDHFADFLQESRKWLAVVRTALKEEYNLFWFCSPSYSASLEAIFQNLGLAIQSRIVWHRRGIPKGRASTHRFLGTWDMILHAGNRALNFPAEWSDAWFDVQIFSQPLTSYAGVDQRIHETQKPGDLIARLIQFGSFPGDRVLDPFAGSGVVGAMCPADRDCVLVEKETEYVERIEERLGIRAESPPDPG